MCVVFQTYLHPMRLTSLAGAGSANDAAVSSAVGRASHAAVGITVRTDVERPVDMVAVAIDSTVISRGEVTRSPLLHKLGRLNGASNRCN